jgi:hypothetical protein
VVRRGIALAGTVRDRDGRPVPGARVALGYAAAFAGEGGVMADITATTDAAGRYRFPHVGAGAMPVTVQAAGYAPDVRDVLVREGLPPVDFQLHPGAAMALRVIDRGGGPVSGATVSAGEWRGRPSLRWSGRTGADGRLRVGDLPADAVTYDVWAPGRMGVQVALTAGDSEQVVELPPALRVSGSVVDAETGERVGSARVISGINLGDGTGTRWDNPEQTVAAAGHYARTFTAPLAGHQLRFVADGYLPELSRTFKPDEGAVTFGVKLRRQHGPSIVVVDADGKPAAGVEVVALSGDHTDVAVQDAHIQTIYGMPVPAKSAADGRANIERPDRPYVLLAVGEQGYAALPSTSVGAHNDATIVLKRWARVTGQTLSNGKPVAGQVVMINSNRTLRSGDYTVRASLSNHGISDSEGRFELKRCVAGPAAAGRTVMHAERNLMTQDYLANVEVQPPPEVTEVTLGAGGRTVRAKVIPPDDFGDDWKADPQCMAFLQSIPTPLPFPANWLAMDDQERQKWTDEFKLTDAGREWARTQAGAAAFRMVVLKQDGSVDVDDVAPGNYMLVVQAPRPRSARLTHEFTVPEPNAGEEQAPLDLGNLELLPRAWPKPAGGRPAE